MGITEVADRLGVHANTARFHLETLVAHGQVEHLSAERGVPGRPARLYRPVRGMDPKGPRHYRALAEALAESLATAPDARSRAVEAGRSWGRRQALELAEGASPTDSMTLLMRMLHELDFAPERPATDPQCIGLRHCPFLELATHRREVVCSLHLGLMRGALEAWDSPSTVDRLDAFVEPDLCSAHLTGVDAGTEIRTTTRATIRAEPQAATRAEAT